MAHLRDAKTGIDARYLQSMTDQIIDAGAA